MGQIFEYLYTIERPQVIVAQEQLLNVDVRFRQILGVQLINLAIIHRQLVGLRQHLSLGTRLLLSLKSLSEFKRHIIIFQI